MSKYSEATRFPYRVWAAIVFGLILIIFRYLEVITVSRWLIFIPFLFLFVDVFLFGRSLYYTVMKDLVNGEPKSDTARCCTKVIKESEDLSDKEFWGYMWEYIKELRKKRITKL